MSDFTFQEKGHKYFLDGKPMTGVTTVLGVLAKPQLIPWAARMTAEWIRQNCEKDTVKIGEGYNCYHVTDDQLQEAVEAHTKLKEVGGKGGTDIHSLIEVYIKDCIEKGGDAGIWVKNTSDKKHMAQVENFIKWSQSNKVKFLASEKKVYSKEWFVAGTFDFSFEKDAKRFLGDLKTYKKIWDRVPHFQCAAYRKMSIEMGEKDYDGTCIVNINKETGELTESWSFDWEGDTKCFEAALTLYRKLNQ